MKVFNEETTPIDIQTELNKKTVWSLIFSAKESIAFVSGKYSPNEFTLYDRMVGNVSEKLKEYGAILKEIFVIINSEKIKLDRESAQKYMQKIIREDLSLIFRIQIENKNYEYQVK